MSSAWHERQNKNKSTEATILLLLHSLIPRITVIGTCAATTPSRAVNVTMTTTLKEIYRHHYKS